MWYLIVSIPDLCNLITFIIEIQYTLKAFNRLNWLKVNKLQNSTEVGSISRNNNVHGESKILFAILSVCA